MKVKNFMWNFMWCTLGVLVWIFYVFRNIRNLKRVWMLAAFVVVLATYYFMRPVPVVPVVAAQPEFQVCKLILNEKDFGFHPCKLIKQSGVMYVVFFSDDKATIEVVFGNRGKGFELIYLAQRYIDLLNAKWT